MSTLTFTAIGGGAGIGANSYLIGADGHEVLLDCGLHPKKEGREALPQFELLRRPPEAVIVSHGHVDHCGAVPYLLKQFPGVKCYATKPTIAIMDRMLHNSVSVMGTLAEERHIREYPLYQHEDVDYAISQFHGMEFGHEFATTWETPVRASFRPSGHVLGAGSILLKLNGHTVYYTGDVSGTHQELIAGLHPLDEAIDVDTLIIESTRGTHADANLTTFEGEVQRFALEANRVLKAGGCVLVPAFALGRTQELLNVVARLRDFGDIPNVPIYASGLGRAVYEIYARFTHHLRPDANLRPLQEFKRVGDMWDRKLRRELLSEPSVIVVTSGMMVENTPSAMLAMEMVQHTRHGIFFVGYLDPDTLGYKLLHAQPGDRLVFETRGAPIKIRLENRQRFHFSAHATRDELCAVVNHIAPKNIVFVHGDADAVDWMRDNTSDTYRKYIPEIGKTFTLDI